jgi:Mrp family chromosome partitioning ATPase
MSLLTEIDEASGREVRCLRLEAAEDGKSILLIEIDERKPGIHREMRYEITAAELIAAIRAHGAELSGEQHAK